MIASKHSLSFTVLCQAFLILFGIIRVSAGPLPVERRNALDVWIPHVLEPTADSIWTAGSRETILWDTHNAPNSISNQGDVVLKTIPTNSTATSQWYHLAGPFELSAGQINVTVPRDVTTGPYAIILFGDSGNESPVFQVNGVDESDGHLSPHADKDPLSGKGQLKRVHL